MAPFRWHDLLSGQKSNVSFTKPTDYISSQLGLTAPQTAIVLGWLEYGSARTAVVVFAPACTVMPCEAPPAFLYEGYGRSAILLPIQGILENGAKPIGIHAHEAMTEEYLPCAGDCDRVQPGSTRKPLPKAAHPTMARRRSCPI